MTYEEVGMAGTTLIKRRGFITLAALAAVSPLVASCTADTGGGGGAPGDTTVTVMAGATDLPKEMIADFEAKNPGIKIKLVLLDPARLNTMLASGNPPDIAVGPAVG